MTTESSKTSDPISTKLDWHKTSVGAENSGLFKGKTTPRRDNTEIAKIH